MATRFAVLQEKEKQHILINVDSANTKKTTSVAVKLLKEYLMFKGKCAEFENYSKLELDSALADFYMEARNKDGEHYKKSTLSTYRHGLQRHIEKTRQDIDIIHGPEFKESCRSFKAVTKELKRAGYGGVDHHVSIAQGDLEKLYDYVCTDQNAKKLQYKVFLDIMLHFGRRGRENLSILNINHLAVTTDSEGMKYAYRARDEQTKNHQDDDSGPDGRMYEVRESNRCPVKSFVKYLRMLNPKCNRLFQQPRDEPTKDQCFFNAVPLGKNTMGNMLSVLSKLAGLSKIYTNHCLRATTVHVLDSAQIPSRHIMTVTGHKSENSLKTYTGITDEGTKKIMSHKLSEKTCLQPTRTPLQTIRLQQSNIPFDPIQQAQPQEANANFDLEWDDTDVDALLMSLEMPKINIQSNTSQNMMRMSCPIIQHCNVTINYNFSK